VSTEQNPRDRLFDPDSDTADVRDREDGPEPVDETEDTIRDPAAHRPLAADPDQRASDAIAEEGAAAPEGSVDDHRVEDNTGDDSDMRAAVPAAAALPGEQPSDEAPGGGETPAVEDAGALLPSAETYRLRIRWREVQLGFVDDPRRAVDDAAELVSLAVDRVASLLRDQVGALNDDGARGDADGGEPDTERLRILMRRYHALLDRMLAV
jgi:hypothetical protein